MKKTIKELKYLKNNGFTLIELLGVLVIMGIIILVVMPNINNILKSNDKKEYSTYYDMIEFGATKYADDARSDLGSTHDVGCTHITLDELVEKEYISAFSKRDVTCSTGSTGIVIRNNNGKITVKYKLNCKKGEEIVFSKGTDDTSVCLAYQGDNSVKFLEELNGLGHTDVNNISYITSNNNYVKFGGQLFRVVSINKTLNTIKIVSADSVATIRYNGDGRNNYTNSDIEMWLNNEYLSTLQKDYKTYLSTTSWKPNSSTTRKSMIGIINKEEFSYIKTWYGKDGSWLLDEGSSSNGYIANNDNPTSTTAVNSFHSVRPAITLNSDTLLYGGVGSRTNPYIVTNTPTGKVNDYLNTRLSGEYVTFSGNKYRIISTNSEGTKLIGTTSIGKKKFSDDTGEGSLSYIFDSSNLGLYLNGNWINSLTSDKAFLDEGDFCQDVINNTVISRISSICIDDTLIKSMKVGLPKLGEVFTSPYTGFRYWTINPNQIIEEDGLYTNSTINTVNSNGTVEGVNIRDENTDTLVVIYLNSEVKIKNGLGTENSPYTIK